MILVIFINFYDIIILMNKIKYYIYKKIIEFSSFFSLRKIKKWEKEDNKIIFIGEDDGQKN